MPEHDRPLDAPAELGIAQESAVSVHMVASVAGPGHDLRDERPAARVRESLGRGSRVGTRDDHGPGTALEHVRIDVGISLNTIMGRYSCAALRGLTGSGMMTSPSARRRSQ